MPFQVKLGAGFLATVLAGIAICIIALYGLHESVQSSHSVISDIAQDLILAEHLGAEEELRVASGRGFLITGDKRYLEKMDDAQRIFLNDLSTLQKRNVSASYRRIFSEVNIAEDSYQQMMAKFILARQEGTGVKNLVSSFEEQLQPKRDSLQKSVANYIALTQTRLELERKRLSDSNRFIFHLVIVVSVIALMLAGAMAVIITKNLSKLYLEAQGIAKMREEIVETVAHDLRNPIAAVNLAAELLEMRAKSGAEISREELQRRIKNIRNATDRVNGLINNLLDLAKLKAGTLSIEKMNVSPKKILADTFELFENIAKKKKVSLEIRQESLPIIYCDYERIIQVLSNLLGNSLRFSASGQKIIFGARLNLDSVVFFVTDQGPGIPDEEQARVFERYWQTDGQKKAGTGLGLAICKGVVAAHQGKIWLQSKLGVGTTFYFSVPLTATDAKDAITPPNLPGITPSLSA